MQLSTFTHVQFLRHLKTSVLIPLLPYINLTSVGNCYYADHVNINTGKNVEPIQYNNTLLIIYVVYILLLINAV